MRPQPTTEPLATKQGTTPSSRPSPALPSDGPQRAPVNTPEVLEAAKAALPSWGQVFTLPFVFVPTHPSPNVNLNPSLKLKWL